MPNDMILIDVAGEDVLAKKLDKLPDVVRDMVTDEVSEYIIKNILRTYPPQKYVTRRAAYSVPFFTDKQRKWFFAALNDGEINVPYRRTQRLAHSWKQAGQGHRSFIYSEYPGAAYVIGDDTQSRHEGMVGWPTVSKMIEKHIRRIMTKADAAIKKAIKKVGLQ